MAKNLPSNTADAAIRAMANAAKPLPSPPKHVRLRPKDAPFWVNVVSSRLRDEWSDNDLVIAAQLARAQADIETQQDLLDVEGFVVQSNKEDGNPLANPRITIIEQLSRREQALMRSLHMGSLGKNLDNARKLQRQGEKLRKEVSTESKGLLAS